MKNMRKMRDVRDFNGKTFLMVLISFMTLT
jgi:hypothetical protein